MATPTQQNRGSHQQADARYPQILLDQHGRIYVGNMEPANRHAKLGAKPAPVSFQPQDWTAPLSPKWLRGLLVPPLHAPFINYMDTDGPPRLVIDYEYWLGMQVEREADYLLFMQNVATKGLHYKVGDLPKIMANPPAELITEAGPPPFPSSLMIQAMADGHPWALGQTEDVPAWIDHKLPVIRLTLHKMHLLKPDARRAMVTETLRAELARETAAAAGAARTSSRTTSTPKAPKAKRVRNRTKAKPALIEAP